MLLPAAWAQPCGVTEFVSIDEPIGGHAACAGDGVTDDTSCFVNAVRTVAGTGETLLLGSKTYKLVFAGISDLTVSAGDFTIEGSDSTVLKVAVADNLGVPRFIMRALGAGPTLTTGVTTDVNTSRSLNVTNTFAVTSAAGISAGDWLRLTYNENLPGSTSCTVNANCFFEMVQVQAVSGTSLTTYDPVEIPLRSAQGAQTIARVVPVHNIAIRNVTIDGSTSTTDDPLYMFFLTFARASIVQDVHCQNFPGGCVQVYDSYGLTFERLDEIQSGCPAPKSIHAFDLRDCTNCQVHTIRDYSATHQAQVYDYGVGLNVSDISSAGGVDRGIKLEGVGYSNFANIQVTNPATTGLAVTNGTYRTTFDNVDILNSGQHGLWMNGFDDEYNTFSHLRVLGSGRGSSAYYDVVFGANSSGETDNYNIILDAAPSTLRVLNSGTGNSIN